MFVLKVEARVHTRTEVEGEAEERKEVDTTSIIISIMDNNYM